MTGLEHRYDVNKVHDPEGKHDECGYYSYEALPTKFEEDEKPMAYYIVPETGQIQTTQTNDNRLVAVVDFNNPEEIERFISHLSANWSWAGTLNQTYVNAFRNFANPPIGDEPTDPTQYADDGTYIWIRHPKTQRWTAIGTGSFPPMTWDDLNRQRGPITVRHL